MAKSDGGSGLPGARPESTVTQVPLTSFSIAAVVVMGAFAANVALGMVKPPEVVVKVALEGTLTATGGATAVNGTDSRVLPLMSDELYTSCDMRHDKATR